MTIDQRFYPEMGAGGFNRVDGTLQFYLRVSALISPEDTIVDLGAGRGAIVDPSAPTFRANLTYFKGRVRRVIGIDIDPVVNTNPLLDEAYVYDGIRLPIDDTSIDLLVSDYTFEHIDNTHTFAAEIERVVKRGGWVCARTPHLFSAVAFAATLMPNKLHSMLLRRIQPNRKEHDVFPTHYRINTIRAARELFRSDKWEHFSYTWSPNPAYHFNNKFIYKILQVFQYIKAPLLGGEVLLIFMRKR